MKVDCQWVSTNLEAFFCDRLTAEQVRLVRGHIDKCGECRGEIEAFEEIDPLVKKVFRYELARATQPGRPARPARRARVFYPAAAVAALAIVVVAVALRLLPGPGPVSLQPSPPTVSEPAATAAVPEVAKELDATSEVRAKPEAAAASQPTIGSREAAPADAGPAADFRVMDPAGYSQTLEDFRGRILLFGVLNGEQPQTAANFQRVYEAFGANTRLRILGVSVQRQAKPPNTTFPIAYNQGSRLLGAASSQFLLVDEAGSVRFRGSLAEEPDRVLERIRAELDLLGIR